MNVLRSAGSLAGMMFKMVGGTFNGALVTLLSLKKAITGTLSTKLFGLDPKDVDFTLEEFA